MDEVQKKESSKARTLPKTFREGFTVFGGAKG